ncbi:MAG: hypothetical protein RLZZ127_2416, partial [Planctomycetota bacterium]
MTQVPASSARSGNALVLTLGVAVLVAALVFSTTDSGIVSLREARSLASQPETVSALEAVLRRR